MYYHPDTHIIYWDVDEGTHTWTPDNTCVPASATVSVPTYSGSCSTAYRDNDWSGTSGWLKLDDIDVSTIGATFSQSLGSLDPTLPLTHIELYNAENDAVQVAGVTIQVGDTYYWLRADWSNAFFDLNNAPYANGDGWLETDQSCVWWMEIELVPAGTAPTAICGDGDYDGSMPIIHYDRRILRCIPLDGEVGDVLEVEGGQETCRRS